MRKIIISTDTERRDWEIYEESHVIDIYGEGFNKNLKHPYDGVFGIEEIDKDGKIKGLFDAGIFDEDIKKAENKRRFWERAEFVVIIDGKEKERFEGTFIDALKYIRKFFKKVKTLG